MATSVSTGATISDVYKKAKHAVNAIDADLQRLEHVESTYTSSSYSSFKGTASTVHSDSQDVLAMNVKQNIAQLRQHIVDMDRLWRLQISKPQRDLWNRKVEQIADEAHNLKVSFDKYVARQNRQQFEENQRAELFQRTKANGNKGAQFLQVYDEEIQALQSLSNSSRMVEEASAAGQAILLMFAEQRDRFKSAQRKALDVLNFVGLSHRVLKLIEWRNRADKWISYAGMVLTVIIVFGVWFWVR